jgi:predicted dehydrogenase/nucleoside-diphosphate-sugar epimerase
MTGVTNTAQVSGVLPASSTRYREGDVLRVGLVGAGTMGAHHARTIAALPHRARLVAVADPSAAGRDEIFRANPGIQAAGSLAEVLEDQQLDVVHVCTPPATHVAVARAALEAGCHVYIEKPVASTTAEADEILNLAAARGLSVCAGHQLLFEEPARVADALLPALGRLVHVESYFSFRTVRRGPGGRAPLRADLQLLDILPHPVYLLLHFLEAASTAPVTLGGLEMGNTGTVHALLRRGDATGHLIATLEGRPIESYVRLVGTNGSIQADFVRGTVQRLFGPGTSGIDKLLASYRIAFQTVTGTTSALSRRLFRRQRNYPGLAELFEAFYRSIQEGQRPPVSADSIRETVRVCETVAGRLASRATPVPPPRRQGLPRVVLTGGTGFLGRALARELVRQGASVRVLARREPAGWERISEVEYATVDLGEGVERALLSDADVVVHAAAETVGGWEEHQRNSVAATEHLVRNAAAAGVRRFIQVSSLAVLARPRGPIDERTPLAPDSRAAGPYVWGKLESERRASVLGRELGVAVKVVRPGAIVDYEAFEPPGRLGKRLGPVFVAVGSPSERLGVVNLGMTSETLAWMAMHFDEAPATLNLLDPELPSKRELLRRLRQTNPDVRVIWLPTPVLLPLSGLATLLQKLLRPGRPAISLRRVFMSPAYDTQAAREVVQRMGLRSAR